MDKENYLNKMIQSLDNGSFAELVVQTLNDVCHSERAVEPSEKFADGFDVLFSSHLPR